VSKIEVIGRVETTPVKEDYHITLNDIRYYHDFYGLLYILTGFITDFMSTDWISFLLPRYTKETSRGALLHDYLFKFQKWNNHRLTMIQSNYLAYDVWIQDGAKKWKMKVALYGLNAGGWITWNKYKKLNKKGKK